MFVSSSVQLVAEKGDGKMGEIGKRGKKDTEIERQQHKPGGYELRENTCLDGIGKRLLRFAQIHVERNQHVGIE